MVQIQPDNRWLHCAGCETFESYCSGLGLPPLSERVDKDVAGRLERARALAYHAYFHYEFLDIALEYSFMTLELLLRRSLALPNRQLKSLVDVAARRGLIPARQARALCSLRNGLAHPTHDYFGGVAIAPALVAVFELANRLAAEPGLEPHSAAIVAN
jgi:hypothetical protein